MKTSLNLLRKPIVLLGLAILAYSAGFTALTLWKYASFHYDNLDLAIFSNVLFNTIHGNAFAATIHPPSYLGDHFSPFIFFLTPLYALLPDPQTLLVIQTIALAASAVPIYYLTRHILGNQKNFLALLPAIVWLLNPVVHNANFFEFHLFSFAVLFIFWAIYGYSTKRPMLYAVMLIFALLVREDMAFLVFSVAVVALLERRDWRWWALPMTASLLWLRASITIIEGANPSDGYKFLIYYGWLGGTGPLSIIASFLIHPIKLIAHLLTVNNLEFVLGLALPFFFLLFNRSFFWPLILYPLGFVWLSAGGGGSLFLMTHYGILFLVALTLVFTEGVKKIESNTWPRIVPVVLRNRRWLYGAIIGASAYSALTYGSIWPALSTDGTNNRGAKAASVKLINSTAPVAATFELLTPLSAREKIYSLHYALIGKNQFAGSDYELPDDTEYIAVDWEDIIVSLVHFKTNGRFRPFAENVPARFKNILQRFYRLSTDGPIMIFSRTDSGKNNTNELAYLLPGKNKGSEPSIDSISRNKEQAYALISLTLPANQKENSAYIIRTETPDSSFDIPFGYGLYDAASWKDTTLFMRVYVAARELDAATFTLMRYDNAQIKLGGLKNLEITTKPIQVTSNL